jgi:osmotically-inducible protein OsmY
MEIVMLKILAIILSIVLFLPSCAFVAGAAAGAAVVGAVYDHRRLEQAAHDTSLSNKIVDKLNHNASLRDNCHINVTVYNKTVLLTGEVPSINLREQAEAAIQELQEVEKIYNQIAVQGPTSSLTRASDSWITTKVRTLMLARKNLKSSTIKIVTENGTVYLLGQVSHDQADQAVDIARKVAGVQKVIKIFQYTD